MSPEQLLGSVESTGRTVVSDFEAGIGTLTRMADGAVDVVVVLVEPMVKSIEVAVRAAALARERKVPRIVVVANRVRDAEDLDRIRAALPDVDLVMVPDDPAIIDADRAGVAPLDHSPDSPAVAALISLAELLVADTSAA
jgi:CO dehydrogenase nickel-insertion accessory protein CooC1